MSSSCSQVRSFPNLTLQYVNHQIQVVQSTERVFGGAQLVGGLDATYLPAFHLTNTGQLNQALNVFAAGPGLQEVGLVVALLTCWCLLLDEINKFLWWPLHLSGYVLLGAVIPLFVGRQLLRSAQVAVSLGPAWAVLALAGVAVLVFSCRARKRLDTYGGL